MKRRISYKSDGASLQCHQRRWSTVFSVVSGEPANMQWHEHPQQRKHEKNESEKKMEKYAHQKNI